MMSHSNSDVVATATWQRRGDAGGSDGVQRGERRGRDRCRGTSGEATIILALIQLSAHNREPYP